MDLPEASTFTRISRYFRRPRQSAGNVYYAKLNTSQGKFYKIGYTTKFSLHERMAYSGKGDERLIEKILFFTPHPKAWDVEQDLLDHFHKKKAFKSGNDPAMPLYKNGQSELFASDILGLDAELYAPRIETTLVPSCEDYQKTLDGCLGVIIGVILIPFTLGISLFFIFGGLAEFFRGGKVKMVEQEVLVTPERPIHPHHIESLINFLSLQQSKQIQSNSEH